MPTSGCSRAPFTGGGRSTYGLDPCATNSLHPVGRVRDIPAARTSGRADVARVEEAAGRSNEFRADLMIRCGLGLTKTYNRVHNADEHDPDIVRLRDLHVELDHAVRDAYGWTDIELDHHHWADAAGCAVHGESSRRRTSCSIGCSS